MHSSLRLLASVSRGQPSKLRKPAVSLDHVCNISISSVDEISYINALVSSYRDSGSSVYGAR